MAYGDFFWKMFEKSGSIEAYVGYSSCKNIYDENKNISS